MFAEYCGIFLFENYYGNIVAMCGLQVGLVATVCILQRRSLLKRFCAKHIAATVGILCGVVVAIFVSKNYSKIAAMVSNSQDTLLNNYYAIVAIVSGLYVGLISFMYPKIFDAENQIKKKWLELYEQFFEKKKLRHYYISLISFFLLVSLMSLFLKHFYAVTLNIVLAIIAVVYNFVIVQKLEEYIFNESYTIKKVISKIDYSKSPHSNSNYYYNVINSLQNNIIYLINDNNSNYNEIKQYAEFINKCIFNYLDHLASGHGVENCDDEYYNYPFDKLQHLNQVAAGKNKSEVSLLLINNVYNDILKIEENYGSILAISDILRTSVNKLATMFADSIRCRNFNANSLDILGKLYLKLIDLNSVGLLGKEEDNTIHQNRIFFGVVKGLVDGNYSFEYFRDIRDKLENIMYSTKENSKLYTIRDNVIALNMTILAYCYYKNKYDYIKGYIGGHFNKHYSVYTLFLDNLNDTIRYTTNESLSVFNFCNTQKFGSDAEESDEDSKYYILFLYMILIKQTLENHTKDIVFYLKNDEKGHLSLMKNIINKLLNMDCVDDLKKRDIYNNMSYDMENIKNRLNKFLQNRKFFDVFEIKISEDGAGYKKFILQQFGRIKKILDNKRNSLLVEAIMNYQNDFRPDKINISDSDNVDGKFLMFEFNKRKLTISNLEYNILDRLKSENYSYIYQNILSKCIEIGMLREIKDVDLANFAVMGNFINIECNSATLRKYFPNEEQFTNMNGNDYVNSIRINEYDVQILSNMNVFYSNTSHSLVIFDKSKIHLSRIRNNHIKEKTSFHEDDENIVVKIPQPLSLRFDDDFVGYFVKLSDS
ncbi:MAG: hypothetical protein LBS34_03070 [Rickettsiales bacterium]|jgi:hypothetical protein|nr:hypothetical protein [Rickettsiales bacterium]